MTGNSENILEINSIEVMYDSVISALHDVSLNVPRGKIVALLGGNGAGKSTTLKSISTMLAAERGKVTKGSIIYDGTEVKNQSPYEMVALGMVQVLEGTSVSIAENAADKIRETLNLPKKAFSYLYSHGSLDQDHVKFFENLMNRIESPEEQAQIIHSANMFYRLYGDIFRSLSDGHGIPLAA